MSFHRGRNVTPETEKSRFRAEMICEQIVATKFPETLQKKCYACSFVETKLAGRQVLSVESSTTLRVVMYLRKTTRRAVLLSLFRRLRMLRTVGTRCLVHYAPPVNRRNHATDRISP